MTHLITWPAGRAFTRAHSHEFGSTEFDDRPDVNARFSPLRIDDATAPVLYAGGDDRTAAAETVFGHLPVGHRRLRRVTLDRFRAWHWSQVQARRDLLLLPIDARLPGASTIVDGGATTYPAARIEAARLMQEHNNVDGLLWASHQLHPLPSTVVTDANTPEVCLLLIGRVDGRHGGVARDELTSDTPVVPFAAAAGLERLDSIAEQLDVTVVRS